VPTYCPWSDLVSYNISLCTGSTTSGFLGRRVRPAQREEQSRMSWLWLVHSSVPTPHWRVRRSSAGLALLESTSNLHPTPPRPRPNPHSHPHTHTHTRAHKTFLNGSRRPAVNLNCPMPASASRLLLPNPDTTPLPSPGERRHRRLTAHIFLSSLALRLDTGQVRLGQARTRQRECGTRQPCLA